MVQYTFPNLPDTPLRIGDSIKFDFTGAPQTLLRREVARYHVQLWGARGGLSSMGEGVRPGYGGFTGANIKVNSHSPLHVYVGGCATGPGAQPHGGWNGGGNASINSGGGGGGATDVRTVGGAWNDMNSLQSRILVAGGGGGAAYETNTYTSFGGHGGGGFLAGERGGQGTNGGYGASGVQPGASSPNTNYSGTIGRGGDGVGNQGGAGGGGGFHGGGGGAHPGGPDYPGGGGSGFVTPSAEYDARNLSGIVGENYIGHGFAVFTVEALAVDPPQRPEYLYTEHTKVKVGNSIDAFWKEVPVPTQVSGIALDQNKVFYELSFYNGASWSVVADGLDYIRRTVYVPPMADTNVAKFRVRAYVLYQGVRYYTNHADGTEYVTTDGFQVYNNNVPTAPSPFQTPSVSQSPIKTGTTLRVAWGAATDADGEALTYELSFASDGSTWAVLSPSISTTYYDHVIPAGDSAKAQYRVRAQDLKGDFGEYRVSTAFQKFDNNAPSNPGAFSFPKATDILSPGDVIRVAFAPAVDPEGDTISYELDLSTDNGVTYVNVTRNLPVAFFEYTFPQISPSEQAKFRVRSKDSNGDFSSYSYSETFKIWTTIPPEKPVLQLLNGDMGIPEIVQYLNPNVAWQFSDRNKDDVQSHYQIQIFRKGATETLVHDSGKKAGNFNVYALPMNIIQWGNIYYYQVKVWDNKGGESQWSDRGYFKPNRSPFVSNLYPGALNMDTPEVSSATPQLGWTFDDPDGDDQVEYFLTLHETIEGTADDPIIYESGFIASNDRFHQVPENTLEDGKRYHWRVSVNDSNGLMDTSEFEYIITNFRAIAPSIVSPVDNHRVSTRPVIEGKLATDAENDTHHVTVFLKNLKDGKTSEFSSNSNQVTSSYYVNDKGERVEPPVIEGGNGNEQDLTGLTLVQTYAWEVQDSEGKWIQFPEEGVDNTFSGRKFRLTVPKDLELWNTYEFQFGATDAGSQKLQMGSEKRTFRVGNEMYRQAFEPIQTDSPATRIYLTADVILAEDVDKGGGKPSEVIVEACNNALDDNPTWENMTEEYLAGTFYEFINNKKTGDDWAVDFRITVKAHDSQGPISIGMYGGTFE